MHSAHGQCSQMRVKAIESFHIKCQLRILGLAWRDYVQNTSLLMHRSTTCIQPDHERSECCIRTCRKASRLTSLHTSLVTLHQAASQSTSWHNWETARLSTCQVDLSALLWQQQRPHRDTLKASHVMGRFPSCWPTNSIKSFKTSTASTSTH